MAPKHEEAPTPPSAPLPPEAVAPVSTHERERLGRELMAAEVLAHRDAEGARAVALAVGARASELGEEQLVQRARLVHADAQSRRGETAAFGLIVREVLAWAQERGDAFLTARAQRHLATFYAMVGDAGSSLERAVAATDGLPPDVHPRLLADHLMCLAVAYARVAAFDAARDRFLSVITLARGLGDDPLLLNALNNLAFSEHEAGRAQEAVRISAELEAESVRTGLPLIASALDTLARSLMSTGAHGEGEAVLAAALANPDLLTEPDDLAELHLTMAECRRSQGHHEAARESLRAALSASEERDLLEVRTRVVEEQSTLAAATGDYRGAYELHRRFHALEAEQRSTAREARARILAAVFETEEAVRSSKRYREMSLRDHLTGLHNRRYAEERLPGLLALAVQTASSLSLAIADLDHFKRVNDTCSHAAGDVVLQRFARLLEAGTPAEGFAARLGGEEFLLVLPRHDAVQALAVCEQLVESVREHDWTGVVGNLPVTASLGLTTAFAGTGTVEDLLAEADRLLYGAKHAGRDRVVSA